MTVLRVLLFVVILFEAFASQRAVM